MKNKKSLSIICFVTLLITIIATKLYSGQIIIAGGHKFAYEIADTSVSREKGLSGKTSMPSNQAMLFKFESPAAQCFWMKDMRFSLDIVWLDSNKIVKHIESNLSPSSYPTTFCPPVPTLYVIEFNAGIAKSTNIKVGDKAIF